MSRYDGSDTYVYPGSEVLHNKAALLVQAALDKFEADDCQLQWQQLSASEFAG